MDNKDKIFYFVNKLKNLFCYSSGLLTYNEKFQEKVNILMNELGNLTGTFDTNIKNESLNIKNDLTIIDSETGERKELVDIISMADRVKNINQINNIYSCLKTLALSNKIAHIYDGEIKKCKNRFINLYNEIFPNQQISDVNFIETLNINFSNLIGRNKYNFDSISDNDFDKMWKILSSNNLQVNKGKKISILKSLNIDFDIKNDEDINSKFIDLCNNKQNICSSYLIKKFKEGQEYVNFENKMFSIKDSYISMIGQLLCKNQFQNIPYQLVKTPDATPGFEYMLIIDDKDLSYYIEVHMPNFIATELIKIYGMQYSEVRSFQKLGASAVYYRENDEIKKIFRARQNGEFSGNVRAEIISRDYSEEPSVEHVTNQSKNEDNSNDTSSYEFITKEISDTPSLFEKFLSNIEIFKELADEFRLNKFNENISINEINIINNQKYNYMYDNFNYDYKEKFINYSINELKKGDAFEKNLYSKIYNNISYDNIDTIAKLIINLNDFKYDFVNNNKEIIKYINMINEDKIYDNNFNDKKYIIDKYIDNYIDDKLNDFNIINKPKKRR